MDELQRMGLMQCLEGFFQPERNDNMTPDEQELIEICCKGTALRRNDNDEGFAAELDKLLLSAKKRGKPVNLELQSTSGATPLVMASLSNGVERVKMLLKHGRLGMCSSRCQCVTAVLLLLAPLQLLHHA
jgi:hypothetical protein